MDLYLILLKSLLKGQHYARFRSGIDPLFVGNNYPELWKLYATLDVLQTRVQKDYTLTDLKLGFFTQYPAASEKAYAPLFQRLEEAQYDKDTVEEYLCKAVERREAFKLAQTALQVAEGRVDASELLKAAQGLETAFKEASLDHTEADPYAHERPNQNIAEFLDSQAKNPGIRWRLDSLNKSLGSLRKGDFGFIFGRPEVGKSAFLLSEGTFMAQQGEGIGIWFDNEEAIENIHQRIIGATIGWTLAQIKEDREASQALYDQAGGRKLYLHSDANHRKFIEKRCAIYKPKFIFINQLDKVRGFATDRYDLEMKAVYQWARELAKQYGPVIGVCQAGSTGENKKYLYMNDVDSSHTAKQGEADWILGIGHTGERGHEYLRYFNLVKNKLSGDSDTNPQLRHNKWSGLIVPEINRYKDFED